MPQQFWGFPDEESIDRVLRSVDEVERLRAKAGSPLPSYQAPVAAACWITDNEKAESKPYYPCVFCYLTDPANTEEPFAAGLETDPDTGEFVWHRGYLVFDPNETDSTSTIKGTIVNAMSVGVDPDDGRPVFLRSFWQRIPEPTTVPPTTTTPGNCTGSCLWTYDFVTKEYTLTENTCSEDCDCNIPAFVPPETYFCDESVTVRTDCARLGGTSAQPPNCRTTTSTTPDPGTTTTTTTTPAGCNGCKWYWRFPGWHRIETDVYDCRGECSCGPPGLPTTPEEECATPITPCVRVVPSTTRPPVCGGQCNWIGLANGEWKLDWYGCGRTDWNCSCDPPSREPVCGEEVLTPCFDHNTTTPAPGSTTTTAAPWPHCSTTTAEPGTCNGYCLFQWWDEFAAWIKIYGCPGCDCTDPPEDAGDDCETVQVPCGDPVTTTTPAPTTPGPTTTPAPTECYCLWQLSYMPDPEDPLGGIQTGGIFLGGPCMDGVGSCLESLCNPVMTPIVTYPTIGSFTSCDGFFVPIPPSGVNITCKKTCLSPPCCPTTSASPTTTLSPPPPPP